MDLTIFPLCIKNALTKINLTKLYEIRLRVGYIIKINISGQTCYLTKDGASLIKDNGVICEKDDIDYIIEQITENSVYAFNEQIKKGFLTSKDGMRVGLGGECVFDGEKIITIKKINSLNFRVPHEIFLSSKEIEKNIYHDGTIFNSLIISPPFCGKTTILKDLCVNFDKKINKPILIIDERGEFTNVRGENIDKITFSDKLFAFSYGIRSLSPHIIVTDEIASNLDWLCAENAVNSGVKIVASIHADNLYQIKEKKFFNKFVFERYFVLNSSGFFGELKEVYNKDFNRI